MLILTEISIYDVVYAMNEWDGSRTLMELRYIIHALLEIKKEIKTRLNE